MKSFSPNGSDCTDPPKFRYFYPTDFYLSGQGHLLGDSFHQRPLAGSGSTPSHPPPYNQTSLLPSRLRRVSVLRLINWLVVGGGFEGWIVLRLKYFGSSTTTKKRGESWEDVVDCLWLSRWVVTVRPYVTYQDCSDNGLGPRPTKIVWCLGHLKCRPTQKRVYSRCRVWGLVY